MYPLPTRINEKIFEKQKQKKTKEKFNCFYFALRPALDWESLAFILYRCLRKKRHSAKCFLILPPRAPPISMLMACRSQAQSFAK
jgi:hypothetical protein